MRKKILAYIIAVLTITTCMIQLIPRQNNIFKIASQGEGESGFLTNNNLNQKKVYLTFDDGPSDHTDEILDILKKNKVRATFFVVGKETEHAKKMYRRIILEGHTLGMHSYSHNYDQIYASVGSRDVSGHILTTPRSKNWHANVCMPDHCKPAVLSELNVYAESV